jgi:hypothetical protein
MLALGITKYTGYLESLLLTKNERSNRVSSCLCLVNQILLARVIFEIRPIRRSVVSDSSQ